MSTKRRNGHKYVDVLTFCVQFSKFCEFIVIEQDGICDETEQFRIWVPCLCFLQQQKVGVVELEPFRRPRHATRCSRTTLRILSLTQLRKATPILVSPPECVGARESNNFLVAESHPVEHPPQMGSRRDVGRFPPRRRAIGLSEWCSTVRKSPLDRHCTVALSINASVPHRNLRATCRFNRTRAGHLEQICIRDFGVSLFDGLQ